MQARLITAEQFFKMHGAERRELVDGVIQPEMAAPNLDHGSIAQNLSRELGVHTKREDLGLVVIEVGFTLRTDPPLVRLPDLSFIAK